MVFRKWYVFCLMMLMGVARTQAEELETNAYGQKLTISGILKSADDGELLVGANIKVLEIKAATSSNAYGFYSLSLPRGKYTLMITCIGFESLKKEVDLRDKPAQLNLELKPSSFETKEVVVSSTKRGDNLKLNLMSAQQINMGTVRKMPALMGEVDLLKAIQLLPGVVSAGEGTSSFSVRGGGIDQNLIVLDEATVYNASHLMGFFSVFNNDAIKNMTLYKGDMPANYDGRLSSLLDVQMRDGNTKKFSGSGGIGLISSRLTLEGPIGSENTTFIVSGRRTYADLFLALSSDKAVRNNTLYFYDLNAKLTHRIDDKNRLFLSGYYGKDDFGSKNMGFNFGNTTVTGRWNHLFSEQMFSNFSLNYSRYNYGLYSNFSNESNIDWKYNMSDVNFKADFSLFPVPEHTVKFGYQAIYHHLMQGNVKINSESDYSDYTLPDVNAFEQAIYASDDFKVSDKLSFKAGLRLTAFSSIGQGTVYNYDQNHRSIDSTVYKSGEMIRTYFRLSPRVGLTYQLNDNASIKANYSRTNQFLQMATNSTAGSSLDLWFTAGKNIKPQICDQFALGYCRNMLNNSLEATVELFYKDMQHTIDFKDHADLMLNRKLDGELRFGNSKAYGAEFQIQKKEGALTGWVSYTYSRSERTIRGINDGKTYLSPYDHPHTVYIVGNYDLNKRFSFGANFVYSTGQPVTYPVARMEVGNVIVPVYSGRNECRMPDYHRMDVSLTYRPQSKVKRIWSGDWNFSVYNVYGHKNPWAINFVADENNPNVTKAQMTYLFTFVPSITYNFKF